MDDFSNKCMMEAIKLSHDNVRDNLGGPFGAVIVKDGKVISRMSNRVTSINDPTAHAEIESIRKACKKLKTFDLSGCMIYTSCEPCPMCLSAIYWARIDKIYYANTRKDAADIHFDDEFIYEQIHTSVDKRTIPMIQIMRDEALDVFKQWDAKKDKILY